VGGLVNTAPYQVIDGDAAGYRVAYAVAEDNLRLGQTVIADSVNPVPATRDAWLDAANRAQVRAREVEVTCSDSQEHRTRVETLTRTFRDSRCQRGKKLSNVSTGRGSGTASCSIPLDQPWLKRSTRSVFVSSVPLFCVYCFGSGGATNAPGAMSHSGQPGELNRLCKHGRFAPPR
jgi:hypothetical protein